jgi:hypothetical protein
MDAATVNSVLLRHFRFRKQPYPKRGERALFHWIHAQTLALLLLFCGVLDRYPSAEKRGATGS